MKSALTLVSFIAIAFFVANCAIFPKPSSAPSSESRIDLSSALRAQAGKTTMAEVESIFGAPDVRGKKNDHEMWIYFLPKSEIQRLTVAFGQSASVVESVLWVPQNSSEGKLSTIRSMFPQAKFHIVEPEQNQHFIVSDLTYVDQDRKVLILSQKNSEQADAVAWRIYDSRLPSAEK